MTDLESTFHGHLEMSIFLEAVALLASILIMSGCFRREATLFQVCLIIMETDQTV